MMNNAGEEELKLEQSIVYSIEGSPQHVRKRIEANNSEKRIEENLKKIEEANARILFNKEQFEKMRLQHGNN